MFYPLFNIVNSNALLLCFHYLLLVSYLQLWHGRCLLIIILTFKLIIMKKAITLFIGIFLITFSTLIASTNSQTVNYIPNYVNYGNSFIFKVQQVEFSVFPDGQFDFTYLGDYNTNKVTISSSTLNTSYNSGFNYEMFIQFDAYGGVIQIENIPIYYDEFGRISQAGDVQIYYHKNRIVRLGGLYVHYNYYGHYTYSTGFINATNFYYTYQPRHAHFTRPLYANCLVYEYPYRRYYHPTRYSYKEHRRYYSNRGRSSISYTNTRRNFNKPGSRNHYKSGRSEANKEYKPNRKNTALVNNTQSNSNHMSRSAKKRSNRNNNVGNAKTVASTRSVINYRPIANVRSSVNTAKRSTNKYNINSNKKETSKYVNSTNSSKRIASNSLQKTASNRKTATGSNTTKRGREL